MIQKIISYVLGFLLLVSIAFNLYLLFGKGINIDKSVTTHQEQFQGQISFNMWMAQGNKVVWKTESISKPEKVIDKLTSLPPQYSYFTHIFYDGSNYVMLWPEFMTEIPKVK